MNRMLHGVAAVAAGLVLTACGSGSQVVPMTMPSDAAATPTATATTQPATQSSAPPAASAAPSRPRTTTPSAKPAPAKAAASPSATTYPLILEPDGLSYVINESTIRQLPLGSDASRARTLVSRALGGPLARTELECPQGTRSSYEYDGFSILVDGTRFVGWEESSTGSHRFTTLDGVGVGSSIGAMKESVSGLRTIHDDHFGHLFRTADGSFGGFLDDKGRTVVLLWGGENCIYH